MINALDTYYILHTYYISLLHITNLLPTLHTTNAFTVFNKILLLHITNALDTYYIVLRTYHICYYIYQNTTLLHFTNALDTSI